MNCASPFRNKRPGQISWTILVDGDSCHQVWIKMLNAPATGRPLNRPDLLLYSVSHVIYSSNPTQSSDFYSSKDSFLLGWKKKKMKAIFAASIDNFHRINIQRRRHLWKEFKNVLIRSRFRVGLALCDLVCRGEKKRNRLSSFDIYDYFCRGLPFKSLPIPRHPHCGAILSLSLPCFPLFVRVCTEYMVGRCGRLRFSRVPTFSQSTPVTELCARPVHRYAPDHRPGISTTFYFSSPSVRY